MKILKFIFAPLIILGSASAPCYATTPTTDDGTSTGKRVGNIISAAVSTAFPAVDKVIQAIWPSDPSAKKNAADAKPAVQKAKENSDQTQRDNLAQLNAVATNLAVASNFLTTCADVDVRVSVIQARLPKGPDAKLTPDMIHKLQDIWKPAGEALEDLRKPEVTSQLAKLDDDFLKSTFGGIQKAIQDFSEPITDELQQGRVEDLKASLSSLEPRLSAVAPLTAILIGDMGTSLAKASAKISGAAGSAKVIVNPRDQATNLALLDLLKSGTSLQ